MWEDFNSIKKESGKWRVADRKTADAYFGWGNDVRHGTTQKKKKIRHVELFRRSIWLSSPNKYGTISKEFSLSILDWVSVLSAVRIAPFRNMKQWSDAAECSRRSHCICTMLHCCTAALDFVVGCARFHVVFLFFFCCGILWFLWPKMHQDVIRPRDTCLASVGVGGDGDNVPALYSIESTYFHIYSYL